VRSWLAVIVLAVGCSSNGEKDEDDAVTRDAGDPPGSTDGDVPGPGDSGDDDADDDGYAADVDCDDGDPAVNPGASEIWYDGVDQDCSGGSDHDADADGFDAPSGGGTDCDDADPAVHPGATEIFYDGLDQDGRGDDDYDQDRDGYQDPSAGGDDCNDLLGLVNPGAVETYYDGVDSDCNGGSDYDADGDGFDSNLFGGDDCDDTDPVAIPTDADGDGFTGCAGDCDDGDLLVYPGAPESCEDGIDQDCSGFDATCPLDDDLTGRTYVLDWDDMVIDEPDSAGLINASDALLFQVVAHDLVLETLTWAGAAANGAPPVPECTTGVVLPAQDFSQNPIAQLGPGTFNFDLGGTIVVVEDFLVTSQFDVDGVALLDLEITGLMDTRAIDAYLGFDTCILVVAFGDTCVPCSDGQVECLVMEATAPSAVWDPAIDVAGTCGL
jgi:hypothetical protein